MKRPTGVTLIAVLMFIGAAGLVLGASLFIFVAIIGLTGGDPADPSSVAIAGMGIAGGYSLLVLAGVTVYLAIGMLKLREWARIAAIASTGACVACTILSLFTFMGYLLIPAVPMILCHLLAMAIAIWILVYLFRPRVRQAFSRDERLTGHANLRVPAF